ncbi:glycosyltransferase [Peptoniphilus sp. EMRHCC_23]|uniref:glycosyltransferase n=1 Tax=Peptoniphilus rachelemmaiella TaxID=2811779 RepID=UPI001C00402C|nr:glycosyltransferase [Peptoniphilus rachelemmaiella]
MKVLHLISGGDTGGAKTHIYTLLKGLEGYGKVSMVCFCPGPFLDGALELGIDARLVEQKNRFDMGALKEVARMIEDEGFDLIHCHGARANFNALYLRKRVDVPMVTTLHSDYLLDFKDNFIKDKVFTPLNKYALKRFDNYIAITERFKTMLVSRGFPEDAIFVTYNGIDMKKTELAVDKDRFLDRYGLKKYAHRMLFVIAARLDLVKDHMTLLRAVALNKEAFTGTHVLIAGQGPEREKLMAYVKDEGLEDLVSFLGQVSDPFSLYGAGDVNLLTSVSESFPYALLEGAKAKIPFIATDVGGIGEMAGDYGMVFQPKDAEAMSRKMLYALNHPDEMKARGEGLYEYVNEHFSQEAMAESHAEIYQKILQRSQHDR